MELFAGKTVEDDTDCSEKEDLLHEVKNNVNIKSTPQYLILVTLFNIVQHFLSMFFENHQR